MKRAIIFGGGSQDAAYMRLILSRNHIYVHAPTHSELDVGDSYAVGELIARVQPDYIFHFAAKSSTRHEFAMENHRAIVDGTLFILEAVKRYCPKAKVFLSGSILQFKTLTGTTVWTEHGNDSIYAAQRNASVDYARYYRSLGLQVYVGYFSHHDSPMRGPHHLAKRLAIEALQVAGGDRKRILLRDPLDEKEWNYAGDMMEAVWDQVNGPCFEALLGSGEAWTVLQYTKTCLAKAGLQDTHKLVDTEFTREPTKSFISDFRFNHHFKTSMGELVGMIVADCISAQPQARSDS